MTTEPAYFQIAFYIISPFLTFLAVAIAYLAIYRQSKPNIVIHYEPSDDAGSIIDLVIHNYGGGTAKDVQFSKAIPIGCFGIDQARPVENSNFLKVKIPILAPGKTLRYMGGQYSGLLVHIGDGYPVTATYNYRTPLRIKKKGKDTSILDIHYMAGMHSSNSAAYDLADAMKGRNNTVFIKTNKALEVISKQLTRIAAVLESSRESSSENT
ncbi:hypothetical protein [Lamprobacter modestohalophilus]|nr:hypothetical protein [Lamprobacter modestohalophilus]